MLTTAEFARTMNIYITRVMSCDKKAEMKFGDMGTLGLMWLEMAGNNPCLNQKKKLDYLRMISTLNLDDISSDR